MNQQTVTSPKEPHGWLLRDLVAGVTVAVVELPQAMAYAMIAGVSPVYGIYTSVIQGGLGALLSANRHVRSGPTNTQSLLVASAIAQQAELSGGEFVVFVAMLTFTKGLIQIVAGLMGAGSLFRFVSSSAVIGISAGAGVLIIAGQLANLAGISVDHPSSLPGLAGSIDSLRQTSSPIDPWAALIGGGTILAMILLPRISRSLPVALVCVIVAILLVWGMKWNLPAIGEIPRELPQLIWPFSKAVDHAALLGSAAALAMLGMVETVAIARTLGQDESARPAQDLNRELWAQGTSNLLSSAVGAIPGSASFSRSMLDFRAGSATRWSGVINAVCVGLFAVALAPAGRFLPLAVLAGILIVIAARLLDWRFMLRVARFHYADLGVCAITFLATILLPLQYAVFVGIGCSLVVQVAIASRLRAVELAIAPDGHFSESPRGQLRSAKLRILQLDGNLSFALRDELAEWLHTLFLSDAHVVIIRLRNTHSIDVSVLDCLAQFLLRMKQQSRHVLFCGIRPSLADAFHRHPLMIDDRGEFLFLVGSGVFESLQKAVAQGIARAAITSDDDLSTPMPWMYVI